MKPDFEKYTDGLVPVIVQDQASGRVLMLGFMNEAAYDKTLEEKKLVFYSRSRKRLWVKGETSGNFLHLVEMRGDCDNDSLLLKVIPDGPVCHTGADTCFGESRLPGDFIHRLEQIIRQRREDQDDESYTASLFRSGLNRIAQKLGEEAVELVIASKDDDRENFINEAADLLFHYLVLLSSKGVEYSSVQDLLRLRHLQRS